MYAEVVVLTYQAPDIGSFTYGIPKNLEDKIKIGQLVQVPFGKRSPLGVVIGKQSESRNVLELTQRGRTSTPPKNIKPINSIVFGQPILLPHQISLLKWMSDYYHAPMVNCLEAALPPLNAKRLTTNAITSNQRPDFGFGSYNFQNSPNHAAF